MFKEYFSYWSNMRMHSEEQKRLLSSLRFWYNTLFFSELLLYVVLVAIPSTLLSGYVNYCDNEYGFDVKAWLIMLGVQIVLTIIFMLTKKDPVIVAVAVKIYSMLYIRHGKAISGKDFRKMKERNASLYKAINDCRCQGICYNICFNILKCLGKGNLLYVAMPAIDEHTNGRKYTLHVLYINNGWCYDTYSQRQMSMKEAEEYADMKVYKSFSIDDIGNLGFYGFMLKIYSDMILWCQENDVYTCYAE